MLMMVINAFWKRRKYRSVTSAQVLLGTLMAAVAPLALDKDKDVRAGAVTALQALLARAVKEAEVPC